MTACILLHMQLTFNSEGDVHSLEHIGQLNQCVNILFA